MTIQVPQVGRMHQPAEQPSQIMVAPNAAAVRIEALVQKLSHQSKSPLELTTDSKDRE